MILALDRTRLARIDGRHGITSGVKNARGQSRTARHSWSGGAASAGLSRVNARAFAAEFEQRPRAQADVFAGQKCDADRLESAPDRPGNSSHWRPPLRLEIVDRTRADRSGRRKLRDRPAKEGARRTALGGGDHRVTACRQGAKASHCDNGVCFTIPNKKSRPDEISSAI